MDHITSSRKQEKQLRNWIQPYHKNTTSVSCFLIKQHKAELPPSSAPLLLSEDQQLSQTEGTDNQNDTFRAQVLVQWKAVHQRKPLSRISSTLRRRSGRNDVILIEDPKTHVQKVDVDNRTIPRQELKGTSTRSTNRSHNLPLCSRDFQLQKKEDQEGIRLESLSNSKTTL